jgi:universal stress protein A
MTCYRRILLAVDPSPDSLWVGQRAQALAAALGAQLEIIHVVEPVAPVAPIPPDPVVPVGLTTQAELMQMAQDQIVQLADELGVPETHCRVVLGDAKTEIVRAADGVDLIVLGSRGRHGLASLIRPTEDVVVHRAPCDVLAVRLAAEESR